MSSTKQEIKPKRTLWERGEEIIAEIDRQVGKKEEPCQSSQYSPS